MFGRRETCRSVWGQWPLMACVVIFSCLPTVAIQGQQTPVSGPLAGSLPSSAVSQPPRSVDAVKSAELLQESGQGVQERKSELKQQGDKIEGLEREVGDLRKSVKKLQETFDVNRQSVNRLEREVDALQRSVQEIGRTLNGLVWVALAVVVGAAVILFFLLRPKLRGPHVSPRQLVRRAVFKPRPEAFRQVGLAMQEQWLRLEPGAVWQDNWEVLIKQGAAAMFALGTREARQDAAALLIHTWVRFVAQFDPDPTTWNWTRQITDATCPPGLLIELLPGPKVGDSIPLGNDEVEEVVNGKGNVIREVLCPGRNAVCTDGEFLAKAGAIVNC